MEQRKMKALLEAVKDGSISVEEALGKMKTEPFEDLGFAKVDHHRQLRQGIAEVIYGAGKTPQQIQAIAQTMLQAGQETILVTRMEQTCRDFLQEKLPLTYFEAGKVGIIGQMPPPWGKGKILIVTGGTSDIPVAEEAAVTAQALGNRVERLYDVGVAGLHRLLSHTADIMEAKVIVAVAGMEGALASVIGGLADCPVVAVPTSVGYGASFGGVSALLAMLNSCASGVSVVNIDNGFGAGYLASMINHIGE